MKIVYRFGEYGGSPRSWRRRIAASPPYCLHAVCTSGTIVTQMSDVVWIVGLANALAPSATTTTLPFASGTSGLSGRNFAGL